MMSPNQPRNENLAAILSTVTNDHSWIAFDCETTGLPPRGRLIELGAIHFDRDGVVISEFHEMARPPHRVPGFITRLTGITNRDLIGASGPVDVIHRFMKWIPPDIPLIAHNVPFDLQILATEAPGTDRLLDEHSIVDSVHIARALCEFPDCRLQTIAKSLNVMPPGNLHRVRADVRVVRALFLSALSRNKSFPDSYFNG